MINSRGEEVINVFTGGIDQDTHPSTHDNQKVIDANLVETIVEGSMNVLRKLKSPENVAQISDRFSSAHSKVDLSIRAKCYFPEESKIKDIVVVFYTVEESGSFKTVVSFVDISNGDTIVALEIPTTEDVKNHQVNGFVINENGVDFIHFTNGVNVMKRLPCIWRTIQDGIFSDLQKRIPSGGILVSNVIFRDLDIFDDFNEDEVGVFLDKVSEIGSLNGEDPYIVEYHIVFTSPSGVSIADEFSLVFENRLLESNLSVLDEGGKIDVSGEIKLLNPLGNVISSATMSINASADYSNQEVFVTDSPKIYNIITNGAADPYKVRLEINYTVTGPLTSDFIFGVTNFGFGIVSPSVIAGGKTIKTLSPASINQTKRSF